ncbi:MAG: hypothetical protein ACK6BG_03915 [Cyanobacteriota bacterium]
MKLLDEIRIKYETLAKVAKLKLRTEEDDLGSPDVGLQDDELALAMLGSPPHVKSHIQVCGY